MTEQELHRANSISNRLNDLKGHLKSIEFVEKESEDDGRVIKFSISTEDGIISEGLKHSFLPIIPEDFIHDYKIYLLKEIEINQKQFDEL